MRHDEARANAEEEFALMQDDRSRLAVELDAALDRSRALEAANAEAGERLASAAQTIARIIGRLARLRTEAGRLERSLRAWRRFP